MLKQLDYSLLISRAHHLITEYYEAPTRYETNRWAQCRRQSLPCLPSIPTWRCILESKSPRWYWWVQHDHHYPRFSPTVGKVNQIESRKKALKASHKGINTEISCKVFESILKWRRTSKNQMVCFCQILDFLWFFFLDYGTFRQKDAILVKSEGGHPRIQGLNSLWPSLVSSRKHVQ